MIDPTGANTVRKHGRDPTAGTHLASPPSGVSWRAADPGRARHAAAGRRTTGCGTAARGATAGGGPTGATGRRSRVSSRASTGRRGGAEGAARLSRPPGPRRSSSPSSGGPRPARLGAADASAQDRPDRRSCTRAPPLGGRTRSFGPPPGGTTDRSRKQERERLRVRAPSSGSSPRARVDGHCASVGELGRCAGPVSSPRAGHFWSPIRKLPSPPSRVS